MEMKTDNKLIALIGLIGFLLLFSNMAHAQGMDTYIVKPNDTLWKISQKYQIGLSEIIEANPQFENPALIYPNDKVNVPNIDELKAYEEKVMRLTNDERAKQGLKPLQFDWQVQRVARYKSNDMRDKNYFSHQSPTYGSPFDMLKAFNVPYRQAGENIAKGQRTPEQVVRDWMNSQGHRQNILKPEYTHIGVGYAKEGNVWTQMFITK